MFVTVATFLQIGAMFTVLTMSAGLMNSIYSIRQLEVNLVSVNKFVERDPKACSAFLADICRGERIVSSRELQLYCTKIKAAHAAVDYEFPGKDRAQERDAAHRKLVDEGAVLDFVKLGQAADAAENNEGEKDDGDAAENNEGENDDMFSLESVNETLAKFTLWPRYKHSLVLTRWATGVNFFVHEQDREFARVMGRIRVMCSVMTLLVEIYGFYALSTGTARCTTKEA